MISINDGLRIGGAVVLSITMATASTGCTGVGYLVGSSIDHHTIVLPDDQHEIAAEAGNPAEIEMKAGGELDAKLIGLASVDDTTYIERYNNWRAAVGARVPSPGSLLSLELRSRRGERTGVFDGFDDGAVLLTDGAVPIDDIGAMRDSADRLLDLAFVSEGMRNNSVPLRSDLIVRKLRDTMAIPLNRIDELTVERGRSGRKWLTGIGGMIDFAGLIVAIVLLTFDIQMNIGGY